MKKKKNKNQINKWTKTINRQNMGKDKQVFLKYTKRTSALLRVTILYSGILSSV